MSIDHLVHPEADIHTKLAFAACQGDEPACRKYLGEGADPNASMPFPLCSSLEAAAMMGHADVARLLLEAGADPDTGSSDGESAPIHIAAWKGHAEVVRILTRAGADPNIKDEFGCSPLHKAAEYDPDEDDPELEKDFLEICRILIDAGADLRAEDEHEETPEDVAAAPAIADLLRAARESRELASAASGKRRKNRGKKVRL